MQPLLNAILPVDAGELNEEERAQLHRELEASIAEAEAGQTDRDELTVLCVWGGPKERGPKL
jgi:hypothetical protein